MEVSTVRLLILVSFFCILDAIRKVFADKNNMVC